MVLNVVDVEVSGVNVVELELERLVGVFSFGAFSSVEVEHDVQLVGFLDVSEEAHEVFEEVFNGGSKVGLEEGVDGLMVFNSDGAGQSGQLRLGSALVFKCILSRIHLLGVFLLGFLKLISSIHGICKLVLSLSDLVHELLLSLLFSLLSGFYLNAGNGQDISDDVISTRNLCLVVVVSVNEEVVDRLAEAVGVGVVDLFDVVFSVLVHS